MNALCEFLATFLGALAPNVLVEIMDNAQSVESEKKSLRFNCVYLK